LRRLPAGLETTQLFSLHSEPVLLNGLDHMKDLSFGSTGVSFLKDDGSVWKINYSQPNANSSIYNTIRSTMPVLMKDLTDISKLGRDLALKKDGSVWIWGRGILAKSKDDATDRSVAPFQVAGLSDIVDFYNGGEHALFVKKDGTVWEWGYFNKNWDELGKEPPKVWKDISQRDGLTDVASVSVGQAVAYLTTDAAVKKDGTLWIWGANFFDEFNPNPLQVEFRLN
jgi:alpha-tubulin suppressor-like RCC1 family protein